MNLEYHHKKIMSIAFLLLTKLDRPCYLTSNNPLWEKQTMNINNKINPIAKQIRDKKYGYKVISNKKQKKIDKLSEKEIPDAKTKQNFGTD